ncbi:hypothetical protein THIBAULT_208 [Mycobacterium phage Thibault]|uniref:Uncharacterized protein n=1 Tax=Mycobacterium phage Thibault TaxID=1052673 RepID=G1FGS1_9CAUD|nr:hypothetical protein CL87_gp175 [Mycobacterium phage Thibault]AEJ94103.1 hypothetical protein THIBAULT_208 [Mycobacterium phage Thibault]
MNNGARILRPEDDRAAMSGRLFCVQLSAELFPPANTCIRC